MLPSLAASKIVLLLVIAIVTIIAKRS